jgi:hypothetical protein
MLPFNCELFQFEESKAGESAPTKIHLWMQEADSPYKEGVGVWLRRPLSID